MTLLKQLFAEGDQLRADSIGLLIDGLRRKRKERFLDSGSDWPSQLTVSVHFQRTVARSGGSEALRQTPQKVAARAS